MVVTFAPICGMHLGFELYDQEIEDIKVSYLLIDLFILRIQLSSAKEIEQ